MTEREALKILELSPDAGEREIKTKYRQLIRQVHPDIHGSSEERYTRHAQRINHAYAVLKKRFAGNADTPQARGKTSSQSPAKKETGAWSSPINSHAYTEREILHYAEDSNGSVLGSFPIARGKYLWKTDEDFPLFLLSVYQCGKELLDEIDLEFRRKEPPTNRRQIHGELTYLLAQQFIDGTALLKEFARSETPDSQGNPIFYMPAMLEFSGSPTCLKPGEQLSPAGVKNHRLYLKNQAGRVLGYLSFPDDRLYYIAIPLFEHKMALVKIQASEKQPQKKKRTAARYQNLHLWIKRTDRDIHSVVESLNLRIERVLKQYQQGSVSPIRPL